MVPPKRAVGQLVDRPARLLLEPVVMSALRHVIVKITHSEMPDAPDAIPACADPRDYWNAVLARIWAAGDNPGTPAACPR